MVVTTIKTICIIIFGIALAVATPAHADVKVAWWVDIEFKPNATTIEGIPVKDIDRDWLYAKVLNLNDIPIEALESEPTKPTKEYGFSFSLTGDFNKDRRKDKALVGVYKDKAGELGKFFLILTKSKRVWKKAFLERYSGRPGFSVLYLDGSKLGWSLCMECDNFADVIWTGKEYKLDWGDEEDDELDNVNLSH